jgi:hypothetical protein
MRGQKRPRSPRRKSVPGAPDSALIRLPAISVSSFLLLACVRLRPLKQTCFEMCPVLEAAARNMIARSKGGTLLFAKSLY